MSYLEEIQKAMVMLSELPNTLFLGQSVAYPGQAMHKTLEGVPKDRRIEMPVAEDFQLGHSIGISLQGFLPICLYPRFDFLLLAANQLVNHLDKLPLMGDFRPKVIIRTCVGSIKPLNPGLQHTQDHTRAFKCMLHTVEVIELRSPEEVMPAYRYALDREDSTLIVEHGRLYA